MTDLSTYAARLRHARDIAGLSRRALSLRAGLAPAHVSMIERNPGADPNGTTTAKIAKVLGIDARWLLTGEGPPPTAEEMQAAHASEEPPVTESRRNGTDG